jgi:hypothetical protein
VLKKTLDKEIFAECKKNTRQRSSLPSGRVPHKKPSVKENTREKVLCRVHEKTLGKIFGT